MFSYWELYVFLAAQSSSRSLVVGPSVGPSVGPTVCSSVRDVCEKVTFRVSNGNLNLPTFHLCDSSDGSDKIVMKLKN